MDKNRGKSLRIFCLKSILALLCVLAVFSGKLTADTQLTLQDATKDTEHAIRYWEERGVSKSLQTELDVFISANGTASQDELKERARIFYAQIGKDIKLLKSRPAEAIKKALTAARKIVDEKKTR